MNTPDPTVRLLLLSSSKVHGSGYLDHCEDFVRDHFSDVDRVLFVPYAVRDRNRYAEQVRSRFAAMGLEVESIHESQDPLAAAERAQAFFVGGGNTFRLLAELYDNHLLASIRQKVAAGTPYMGSSAGTNIACPTVRTTNDMPIVFPPSLDALGLVSFQINPHYLDTDPASVHQGESRETRIREFHEENESPVVALREGALLVVDGSSITLHGDSGGRLFRRERETIELEAGARLDELVVSVGSGR
ncbi:MAG: dipeptidase PepE [Thermoanaerobaculia bacterium]